MASSTPSAITAQLEPEEAPNGPTATSRDDSAAGEAPENMNTSNLLPNGRGIRQRTSYDPLLNPKPDNNGENNDDDDRPAPFPPYREPDDDEIDEALSSHGHDPLEATAPADLAPLPSGDNNPQISPDADEALPEPDAEIPPEQTSEAPAERPSLSTTTASASHDSEAASETSLEATQEAADVAPSTLTHITSPAAPPPPYWTHSRDGSQGHNSRNNNASLDAGRPATAAAATSKPGGFFGAPFLRRLDSSSRGQGTTASSSSTQRPYTGVAQSSSLNGGNRNHRRDTSTSTLDLNVNIITLQDNEASDVDDGYSGNNDSNRHNGWQYNGPPAFSTDGSSSAVSSPTALLSPGPPPGSAGSSNSRSSYNSGSIATTATTLAATRTTSNTKANRCWARRVDITDHVVIGAGGSGGSGGSGLFNTSNSAVHPRLGAFVVWTIRVQTLESTGGRSSPSPRSPSAPNEPGAPSGASSAPAPGHSFCIYKRYSEFDTLRKRLVASFPQARGGGALPPLPPKSVLGKFRPEFLEKRRLGLQYFLNCILLNPEFAGSPVLRDFLFS
ncbi:hypothetical protein SEUCBS139899_004016 [Sporothrix eucalyptigena]|uniref:Endosomal/vacuolar adapter protein YPT35 n=1 Tax=Sporothrix eucalyptigena TaxID=1812306 RepID=A0ABP0AKH3_9PEZI